MDAVAFEQVYGAFQDFPAYCAALFGCREPGTTAAIISRPCWCSPASGATPRICPKRYRRQPGRCSGFAPNPPWDDDTVIGRLQEYVGPRLGHLEGVWAGGQRLSQAGGAVGGSGSSVLRPAGQGVQLPGWNVPGLRQPVGTGPGGQTAVSAGETEFETEQSDVGLDEYETRTWAGWHHHVALCRAGNRIGGK